MCNNNISVFKRSLKSGSFNMLNYKHSTTCDTQPSFTHGVVHQWYLARQSSSRWPWATPFVLASKTWQSRLHHYHQSFSHRVWCFDKNHRMILSCKIIHSLYMRPKTNCINQSDSKALIQQPTYCHNCPSILRDQWSSLLQEKVFSEIDNGPLSRERILRDQWSSF